MSTTFWMISSIVWLVIALIAAMKYDEIAKMKGHEGYAVWCFFLGIIGWIMVAALPDRSGASHGNENGNANLFSNQSAASASQEDDDSLPPL